MKPLSSAFPMIMTPRLSTSVKFLSVLPEEIFTEPSGYWALKAPINSESVQGFVRSLSLHSAINSSESSNTVPIPSKALIASRYLPEFISSTPKLYISAIASILARYESLAEYEHAATNSARASKYLPSEYSLSPSVKLAARPSI